MNLLLKDTSPAVEKYLKYKQVIQGRSLKTVEEYRIDLRTFFRYIVASRSGTALTAENIDEISIECVDIDYAATVSTLDILEFLSYAAQERGNAPSARARKLSAIKNFYRYLTVTERVIKENPAINIETPQKKKSLPKYLTVKECVSLLETVVNDKNSKSEARDYCILTLFINCGMRLSELVGISLSDIQPDLSSLRVVGKGSKERIIYLNDAAKSSLSAYLLTRARDLTDIKDKNALFLSRLGKRISVKTVQWLVSKYLGEAGLDYKHYSTHKLRHTAATLMYQSGKVDVLTLKEILGHEQLNTTQIYTHVNDANLARAVAEHPMAEFKPVINTDVKPEEDDSDGEK